MGHNIIEHDLGDATEPADLDALISFEPDRLRPGDTRGPAAGHENELLAAVMELVAAVRRETGCVAFDAVESYEQPGRSHLVETYDDVDAFRTHLDTPHVQQFFTSLWTHSRSSPSDLTQLTQPTRLA